MTTVVVEHNPVKRIKFLFGRTATELCWKIDMKITVCDNHNRSYHATAYFLDKGTVIGSHSIILGVTYLCTSCVTNSLVLSWLIAFDC
jgi:hypothetical protein